MSNIQASPCMYVLCRYMYAPMCDIHFWSNFQASSPAHVYFYIDLVYIHILNLVYIHILVKFSGLFIWRLTLDGTLYVYRWSNTRYVCICACVYVCMYVCVCVCVFIYAYIVWMGHFLRIAGKTHGMYVCVCIYIFIYIYIYIYT